MAKQAYSWTIVSLASSGHEESYLLTLEVQKEKDAEAEIPQDRDRKSILRPSRLKVAEAQIWNFPSRLKVAKIETWNFPSRLKDSEAEVCRGRDDQKIPRSRRLEYSEMEIICRGRDEQNIPNILIKKIAE